MQCMLSYAGTARLKVQPASWVQCSSEMLWQAANLAAPEKYNFELVTTGPMTQGARSAANGHHQKPQGS